MAAIETGQPVRWWKPGHAEHGWRAAVACVEAGRVYPQGGAWTSGGAFRHLGTLPLECVVTEAEYQRRRRDHRDGWLWPD